MDKVDKSGDAHELKIIDVEDEPSFDFTEIPKGLQHFCNAITLVSKILNVGFSYKVLTFSKDLKSTFKKINDQERLGILVSFQSTPEINLIEIDSSDDKFVSTLIFKDLKIKQKDFFHILLNDLAKSGGKWNKEFLSHTCTADTIRHPKNLQNVDGLDAKSLSNISKTRIAKNLINALT